MSGTIQGSVANYSCTVGYILDGPSQRQCGSDGEWNDSAPECERKDVHILTTVEPSLMITNWTYSILSSLVDSGIAYVIESDLIRTVGSIHIYPYLRGVQFVYRGCAVAPSAGLPRLLFDSST